jgi:hypothetical protein
MRIRRGREKVGQVDQSAVTKDDSFILNQAKQIKTAGNPPNR